MHISEISSFIFLGTVDMNPKSHTDNRGVYLFLFSIAGKEFSKIFLAGGFREENRRLYRQLFRKFQA
jgi:hypothetical protein